MDSRRLPFIAILFLILLRLSIGWQFLYEGLWKHNTLSGPEPWTAEGYLKNAQGPFRETFRNMVGDPDELGWLDYATVSGNWNNWRDRFAAHYGLSEAQQQQMNLLIDATATGLSDPAASPAKVPSARKVGPLPPTVNLKHKDLASLLSYDPQTQVLKAAQPLLPSEEDLVLKMLPTVPAEGATAESVVPDPAVEKFRVEFQKLAEVSRKAVGYRHRLAAQLRGNAAAVGVAQVKNEKGGYESVMTTITSDQQQTGASNIQYGDIQEYKDLLRDYEQALAQARIDYQFDHAETLKKKLGILRSNVVGPVRTLDTELKKEVFALLTIEQLARGAMPPQDTPLHRASIRPMWALLIFGTLLILGLGTRFAAVGGAVLLLSFYLVIPPWPGVPQPPGPEHSLFINKNLIEVIALLGIAALPTGTWFGLDGLLGKLWRSRQGTGTVAAPATATPAKSPPPALAGKSAKA